MKIRVGLIINTHGIKGEVKLKSLTDDNNRFRDLKTIYLEKTGRFCKVLGVKFVKDTPILKLEGIDSIEEASIFKNTYISIDKEDLVDLPEDTYFIFDIIGCSIININNDSVLGKVVDVITYTPNDVYVVELEDSKKEVLIPVVKEFIKQVNIKDKKIFIDPIEGMIE